MPTLDLLKRSELARGLTNAEEDANKTALELFINALLAGTAGYQAGDALKLGGVLADLFWNDNNCNGSITSSGWQKFKNGLILQWGIGPVIATNSNATITYPTAFSTGMFMGVASITGTAAVTPGGCALVSINLTQGNLYNKTGNTDYVSYIALGK